MADKALLLGINEYKNVPPLQGCVNDTAHMRRVLTEVFGFEDENVKTLTNGDVIKAEVRSQMRWLLDGAAAGDRVVLHFSGHGSYTVDVSGDEQDGADELICLYDMDFNDPNTYLLDDELGDWTKTAPPGVQLCVVLDSCHSGTGTRELLVPLPTNPSRKVPIRVDLKATLRRTLSASEGSLRDVESAAAAAAVTLDAGHGGLVRVRFVDPPPEIKAKVARRMRQGRVRDLVIAPINHVLLAACRKDQTAADAIIDGEPNGAFTFYLCETLRDGGPNLARPVLIGRLESALRDHHFDQSPQLEVGVAQGPLFPGSGLGEAPTSDCKRRPTTPVGHDPSLSTMADLADLFDRIARLAPPAQPLALQLLAGTLGPAPQTPSSRTRGPGGRHLVYVHGICKHSAHFSDPWWESLHPFTDAFGDGTLDVTRHEVLWSDLVNERGLRGIARGGDDAGRSEWAARVRGVLEERAAVEVVKTASKSATVRPHDLFTRELKPNGRIDRGEASVRDLSIPGLNCVDDFSVYMFNDGTRAQIVARFTDVVRPLLAAGDEVEIISHSWGTVVAYEGLRALEDEGFKDPKVGNFFTAGAALSIFLVKSRLLPANRDGRKPAPVATWVNLNAHHDPVGGPLKGNPYAVDEEYLGLSNLGCGLFDVICAHGSYFKSDNDAVNRDIFAAFINQV